MSKNLRRVGFACWMLMAATLVAPPAAASHTVDVCSGASSSAGIASVSVSNCLFSRPSTHCTGTAGNYVSCIVEHHCGASASGALTRGEVTSCTDAPTPVACVNVLTTSCSTSTHGTRVVQRGACATFSAAGRVATLTGTTLASASPASLRLCVDGWGPFQA